MPQGNGLLLKEVSPDEAEKLVMPAKGIALHLKDATLSEALDELQKQSGVKLNYGWADKNTLDKKVSVDMETRYFQPAFDAITDEAGVKASLQVFGNRADYNVQFGQTNGDKTAPLLSGVGPFQLRLQSVQSNFNQTVNVSADKKDVRSQNRQFSIDFSNKTDPIVNIVGSPMILLKRVEDDKGRSLLDANDNRRMRYGFEAGWGANNAQNVQVPAADAKMLARVEGTATYVVPSAWQQWEIADVLGKKDLTHEFQSGGRTITVIVKGAEGEGNSINLKLEINAPPQGNNEGGTDPLLSFSQIAKAFTLQDANGNVLRTGGYSGSGRGGAEGQKMQLSGVFVSATNGGPRGDNGKMPAPPEIAEPVKLVFDAPTEFVQTTVPFAFKDVPLP